MISHGRTVFDVLLQSPLGTSKWDLQRRWLIVTGRHGVGCCMQHKKVRYFRPSNRRQVGVVHAGNTGT